MTYTYYINLVEAIIGHQMFLQQCRELPTVALPYRVKIRELLTSAVFAVNRY